MIYVSVQPDNTYFHWQVEVCSKNLLSWGAKPQDIHVVWMINGSPSPALEKLIEKVGVSHFMYQLEDVKGYLPAIKPQGMKHHCKHLGVKKFFFHDSDIIFLKKPMIDNLCACAWHSSDCRSYLDSKYIKSKSEELFIGMCNIVGVNPRFIESKDNVAGGAQWVLNNTTPEFWEKVEKDSIALYNYCVNFPFDTSKGQYPIQAWTAEMWATLWNALAYGKEVCITDSIDFTFATSSYEQTKNVKILHLAGVVPQNRNKLFYKGDYTRKSPLGENFDHLSKDFAAWRYVEEMQKIT